MNVRNKYKYTEVFTFPRYVLIRLIVFSVELVFNATFRRNVMPSSSWWRSYVHSIYLGKVYLDLIPSPWRWRQCASPIRRCRPTTLQSVKFTRLLSVNTYVLLLQAWEYQTRFLVLVVYKPEVYYQYRAIILSVASVCQLGYRINLAHTIKCLHARWTAGRDQRWLSDKIMTL